MVCRLLIAAAPLIVEHVQGTWASGCSTWAQSLGFMDLAVHEHEGSSRDPGIGRADSSAEHQGSPAELFKHISKNTVGSVGFCLFAFPSWLFCLYCQ